MSHGHPTRRGFNSILVRLKVGEPLVMFPWAAKFQFHTGSIKSCTTAHHVFTTP